MTELHANEIATSGTIPGVRPDVLVHPSDAPEDIRSLLREELYPNDAYHNGVYWADLPGRQRTTWIVRQYNQEATRQFGVAWAPFWHDPLQPFFHYFHNYVVTGLGYFTEGYVLFSVGNILILFEAVWGSCFKTYKTCNKTWVESINYLELVGIIFRQILVGIIGDWIGRRWWIIQDAIVMFLGTVMLTAMWGTSLNG